MNESSQRRVILLRAGLIISIIFALLGCYWLLRAPNTDINYMNFSPMMFALGGGLSLLIGFIGGLISCISLHRTEGGFTRKFFSRFLLIPGIVFAVIIIVILEVPPFNAKHMRFQNNLGKRNYGAINMEGEYLTRWRLNNANLNNANLNGTTLRNASLENASLKDANLIGAALSEINFNGADLSGANLMNATMIGTHLSNTNLKNAILEEENLLHAGSLRHAIMPDGTRYDGRFFLEGDLYELRQTKGRWEGFPCDNDRIAEFYGISTVDYLLGQEWARENLPLIYTPINNLKGMDVRGEYFVFADFTNKNLQDTIFFSADLQYTDFTGADLSGADLENAYLCGAKITDEQLCTVSELKGATMPDGSKYDGRYNLSGDVSHAESYITEILHKNPSPEEMAEYYDIPYEEYLAGQEWTEENLERVCGRE